MQINGQISGDLMKIAKKWKPKSDTTESTATMDFYLGRAEIKKIFGETVETLAFSSIVEKTYEDGESNVMVLQDVIKPGKRIVTTNHIIRFDDIGRVKGFPVIENIKPVVRAGHEQQAIIRLVIPLDTIISGFETNFMGYVGTMITLSFTPTQLELGLGTDTEKWEEERV